MMNCYKFICNTLAHTTEETTRSYYNTKITTSENKIKMTWNTVKSITNRRTVYKELKILKIDRKSIKDCQVISNSLNYYFKSTAIIVNDGRLNIGKFDINHPTEYLYQTFKKYFPSIKFKYTPTKEIKKNDHISKTF